jgi:regulatory protein
MTFSEAYNLALNKLSRREHSRLEILQYLERKKADAEISRDVVQKLVQERLLDETRFAKMLALAQSNRGKGARYVHGKLRQKGISLDLDEVRNLLGEVSKRTELESAQQIVERRYPNSRTDKAEAARAFQALVRRGFSFDIARQAVFSKTEG